jgi:hypothetical protein
MGFSTDFCRFQGLAGAQASTGMPRPPGKPNVSKLLGTTPALPRCASWVSGGFAKLRHILLLTAPGTVAATPPGPGVGVRGGGGPGPGRKPA